MHVDVWQKLNQYCKAIINQLTINKYNKTRKDVLSRTAGGSFAELILWPCDEFKVENLGVPNNYMCENSLIHVVCKSTAAAAAAAAKSLQSCPTLCDPIDGSPPGSPVPGILQARTLEWVAIAFSNA